MSVRKRLRSLAPAPSNSGGTHHVLLARLAWMSLGGVAGAVWWEHWLGAGITAVLAAAAHIAARRREPLGVRRERARQAAELPFALDVGAAVLRGGAPVDVAVRAAAEVTVGNNRQCLTRTARALRLGAAPEEACQWLTGIAGQERVAAAITRSIHSGAMLAGGLELLAGQLREERELEVHAATHRDGVWMVLPLCLCFLPAFAIAGLLPVLLSAVDLMLFQP